MPENKPVIGLKWEPKLPSLSDFSKPSSSSSASVTTGALFMPDSKLIDGLYVPPNDPKKLNKLLRKQIKDTSGKGWFDMPAPVITPQLKQDLKLLQLRGAMDPKRHYKKSDLRSKNLPKYFQIGTVVEPASEYYSARLTKKERKRTLAEELQADPSLQAFRKRKVRELEEQNRPASFEKWRNKGWQTHKRAKERSVEERPEWDQVRKRSRMNDDSMQEYCKALVPVDSSSLPIHKELRLFLEEEQKLSEARLLLDDDQNSEQEIEEFADSDGEITAENQLNLRFPFIQEPEIEEDDETRKEKGKGNVEKWLQMLLKESTEEQHQQIEAVQIPETEDKSRSVSAPKRRSVSGHPVNDGLRAKERTEKGVGRSESARAFRVIPSSPSMILGMKKGVDCIRKKPLVIGDEENEQENIPTNYSRFLRSPFRSTKKAAK